MSSRTVPCHVPRIDRIASLPFMSYRIASHRFVLCAKHAATRYLSMSIPVLAFTREACKVPYDAYMDCTNSSSFIEKGFLGKCEDLRIELERCLKEEVSADFLDVLL